MNPRSRDGVAVVWEDDDLLVMDKPPGMACLPEKGRGRRDHAPESRSLVECAEAYIAMREGGDRRGGRTGWRGMRPHVVQMLDAEASGLVLVAVTPRAIRWASDAKKVSSVKRYAHAVVEGAWSLDPECAIERGIEDTRDERVRTVEAAPAERGGGRHVRHAVTRVRVADSGPSRTMVRVQATTGVRHQARAHLASAGHPVAGDRLYDDNASPGRLWMHASEVLFTHPGTGETVHVRTELPPDFAGALQSERTFDPVDPDRLASVGNPDRDNPTLDTPTRDDPSCDDRSLERVDDESPTVTRLAEGQAHAPKPSAGAAAESSWDQVAGWYDGLVETRRNDLLADVVHPGALSLLDVEHGECVLDIGCGQGAFARAMAAQGAEVWGLDASPRLIQAAEMRGGGRFAVADATRLDEPGSELVDWWPEGGFDAATCVMALMNMASLAGALQGVATRLRPGGRLVAVVLHPAFRNPGRTSWGWDGDRGSETQFRRIDGYLSEHAREIVMNPGEVAHGTPPVTTLTYHRPIGAYVEALAGAGFAIDACTEWASPRMSEPGPRAQAENHARAEIPMFLAIRAWLVEREG